MPVLTDLAAAEVKASSRKLYGNTLAVPLHLVTGDGAHDIYVVDVNIGPTDPTGKYNQYIDEKNGKSTDLTGLPGQLPNDWQLGDELTINTVLHNVPLSRNNADLIYAGANTPVELTRSNDGTWEVTAFSRQGPGTFIHIDVDIPDITLGPVGTGQIVLPGNVVPGYGIVVPGVIVGETHDFTISSRFLTLGELGEFAPFGVLPLGAVAVYSGTNLIRIQ